MSPLVALERDEEMAVIARGRAGPEVNHEWFQFLRNNEEFARELGAMAASAQVAFSRAFPGETRDAVISNDEWRRGGYDQVAIENELMGRAGS